jgi:hypothetical protein
MRNILLLAGGVAVAAATIAEARTSPRTGTPATIQRLMACRSMADAAQRLSCYDREATAVDVAIAKHDLVVIDKARATAAKQSLFGFSIPNFGGLFGGDSDDIKQIQSTVRDFGYEAGRGWVIKLADGSTWFQTDDAELGLPPEKGQKVVVARGSLGSFFLRLNGQPGFKVRRIG